MAAPNAPNPLFAEVPEKVWELHHNPLRMAASLLALILWIHEQVAARGAAENGGNPKVFTVLHGPSRFRRIPYERRLLPNSGFFKVVMRVAGEPDVTLLFSFSDLYLIGFLHENVWRVFTDARIGHLTRQQRKAHCTSLGFDGRYSATRWSTVLLGINELFVTHDTLSHYTGRGRERDEVKNALFRLMVVIAEATRFHRWLSHLLAMIRDSRSEPVDAGNSPEATDASMDDFSDLFQNWSTISKSIMDGPYSFERGDCGFDTYLGMLYSVSVLLPDGHNR